jgi:hypothetical protein
VGGRGGGSESVEGEKFVLRVDCRRSKQQTADSRSRQQTAEIREQTAEDRDQTAESRNQTAESRQYTEVGVDGVLAMLVPRWYHAHRQ